MIKKRQEIFKKIDPRKDIVVRKLESDIQPVFRNLSDKEKKRVARWESEDNKIHMIYPELNGFNRNDERPKVESKLRNPPGLVSKLLNYQLIGVNWMKNSERTDIRGGILADEMGMGKTLQIIGLLLSGKKCELNLVILPTVAINQWISELQTHAPNMFNIHVHHGRNKLSDDTLKKLDYSKFNIILTTYGTVENDYRRKVGIFQNINVHRLILDEAHSIKDSRTSTSTAISAINTKVRWALTGTPVQNRIGDLFSLIKYLRLYPESYYFCKKCDCRSTFWLRYNEVEKNVLRRGYCVCGHFSSCHFGWWNRKIGNPIKQIGYTTFGKEVFNRLHELTSKIVLRRTKLGIEKELGLPSKVVAVVRNYFSEKELDFYTALYTQTKGKFDEYAVKGEVGTNYAHIFELLQKMRLAVNHPHLVFNSKDGYGDVPICGYCNEEADDPIVSQCKHVFCREEAVEFLEKSQKCPVCKINITIDLNQKYTFEIKAPVYTEKWVSSTKIEYLVQQLTMSKSKNSLSKALVFSQFVNFLEILRWRLERAGFKCVKIYGTMPASQRKVAIDTFNTDKDVTVFLISLKAGGVALNLTEATNVYLMDLWWNPAVEEQAMDRIHRIGQHRPIRIHKVIIENSIESRVLALQQKKKALFESALDNDHSALQRLTEEDLAFLFS